MLWSNYWTHVLHLLKPMLCNKSSHGKKSMHCNWRAATRESPHTARKTQCSQKEINLKKKVSLGLSSSTIVEEIMQIFLKNIFILRLLALGLRSIRACWQSANTSSWEPSHLSRFPITIVMQAASFQANLCSHCSAQSIDLVISSQFISHLLGF